MAYKNRSSPRGGVEAGREQSYREPLAFKRNTSYTMRSHIVYAPAKRPLSH